MKKEDIFSIIVITVLILFLLIEVYYRIINPKKFNINEITISSIDTHCNTNQYGDTISCYSTYYSQDTLTGMPLIMRECGAYKKGDKLIIYEKH